MSDKAAGPLRRLWRGFWRLVTATRRGLANLLFLGLVALIVAALTADDRLEIEEGSLLLLAPTGEVVQQRSFVDPLAHFLNPGALDAETPLRDLIDAVDAAADDPLITGILIDLQDLHGIDISSGRELGAALTRFREKGKVVVARGDNFSQGGYLVASYADEIYLHPMGMVAIEGFGVYPAYLKDLLDRLRVDMHVFRVGDYKAAVEPFLRNDMSAQARENSLRWLQSLWRNYTTTVSLNRDLHVTEVEAYVDHFDEVLAATGGDAARAALDRGLVDRVLTREEMTEQIKKRAKISDIDEQVVHFYDYLGHIDRRESSKDADDQVAVVVAEGMIVDGDQPPGVVGGDSVAALLREAREDEDVKAVVLRINSEGGSAFASEVIREQVGLLQAEGKPVVASMGSVAASGGYWIAAGADEIWAQPTTITGSIGIFGVLPSIYRSLERLGVHTDGVGTTRLADGFRLDRPLSEIGAASLQSLIERGYQRFISLVAETRGMSEEAVGAVAQGQVWSGQDALERGLVDRLGGVDEAIAAAAAMAELESYRAEWYSDEGWLESSLLERIWGTLASSLGTQLRAQFHALGWSGLLLGGLRELPVFNDPMGLYLQCLECAAQ